MGSLGQRWDRPPPTEGPPPRQGAPAPTRGPAQPRRDRKRQTECAAAPARCPAHRAGYSATARHRSPRVRRRGGEGRRSKKPNTGVRKTKAGGPPPPPPGRPPPTPPPAAAREPRHQ